MRLLFVSGTAGGGSGRSQRELADRLRAAGHSVTFLVDDKRPARLRRVAYEQLSDLAVRLDGRVGARLVRSLEAIPGRRAESVVIAGIPHLASPVPENAFGKVLASTQPDVVVASSLVRLSWRKIRAECGRRGETVVLYVRETESIDHVKAAGPPEAVVANAESLCERLRQQGTNCTFVPSLVDVDRIRTVSTRRAVLAINLVPSRGIDTVLAVAAALPEIPFVAQESWPLDRHDWDTIEKRAASLPNVELRRAAPPGPELYGDAKVLMVPYRVDNRPRVIAEAQANGIPVVASDRPALREAVGRGGVIVSSDDADAWAAAIRDVFADDARYDALSAAALECSREPERDPDQIVRAFESVLERVRDMSTAS